MAQRDVRIKVGVDNQASNALRKIGGDVERFGSKTNRVFGAGVTAVGKYATSILGLSSVLAGLKGGQAIAEQFESIDEIAKTSRKLGVLTDDLIGMRMAAAEMSGMAAGQFDMALQRMTRRVAEAAQGTGEAKAAIAELGLSAQTLNRVGPARALELIADAMKSVQSPADRLRLAFKLFDSEGAALVTTLSGGSEAIREIKREAKELGTTFDDIDASKIEAANDAIARLKASIGGLAKEAAVSVSGPISAIANRATNAIKNIRTLYDQAQTGTLNNLQKILGRQLGGNVGVGKLASKPTVDIRGEVRRSIREAMGDGPIDLKKALGVDSIGREVIDPFADIAKVEVQQTNIDRIKQKVMGAAKQISDAIRDPFQVPTQSKGFLEMMFGGFAKIDGKELLQQLAQNAPVRNKPFVPFIGDTPGLFGESGRLTNRGSTLSPEAQQMSKLVDQQREAAKKEEASRQRFWKWAEEMKKTVSDTFGVEIVM